MNRYGLRSVLFMLLAALLIGSGPAAGEFPVDAQNVTADCTVSLSGSAGEPKDLNTAKLLDGEYTTYVPLSGGDVLRITAAAEFTALYIIWNKVPGSWTLSAGNHSYTLGTHGYLHEFVDVKALTGAAVKEASVTIPKDLSVCDVYAFTEGSLPDWVQVWQPPCEKADLMLLSTHSDDEQLFFAGVLPYYAGEIGAAVQVVYLTNHWDVQNRPHEQINGLWTVGVRNYPIVRGRNAAAHAGNFRGGRAGPIPSGNDSPFQTAGNRRARRQRGISARRAYCQYIQFTEGAGACGGSGAVRGVGAAVRNLGRAQNISSSLGRK